MDLIQQAITNVLPDTDVGCFSGETKLADIPGWDSMNAVNFLLEIESLSGRQNLQLAFGDEVTISQIVTALRAKGIDV
jgi:hypothetical protein